MQERALRGTALALAGTAVVSVVPFVPWAAGASSEDMAMASAASAAAPCARTSGAWSREGEIAFNGAHDDEGWYGEGWSDATRRTSWPWSARPSLCS